MTILNMAFQIVIETEAVHVQNVFNHKKDPGSDFFYYQCINIKKTNIHIKYPSLICKK